MQTKKGALSASVNMMLKNAKQSNAVCVNKVSTGTNSTGFFFLFIMLVINMKGDKKKSHTLKKGNVP